MFILDTNTVIYYFKGVGNVSKHWLAVPPREVFLPAIVLYELEVGIAKSNHPKKFRKQLDILSGLVGILSFDKAVAEVTADLRAKLEKKGAPIGPLDTLIAGTALAEEGVLVTHNTQEFSRVEGLKLVDWY